MSTIFLLVSFILLAIGILAVISISLDVGVDETVLALVFVASGLFAIAGVIGA